MKVIFGSYIEVIIDPQMDLGEMIWIVFAHVVQSLLL
jgi:hypothetical protein